MQKEIVLALSDEAFEQPAVVAVRDGDALLFANFRPDRAREVSAALLDPAFDGFARSRVPLTPL